MTKELKFEREKTQDAFVSEKFDIIQNCLLGNYDSEGNYYITPIIISELVALEKTKKSVFNNSVYCTCNKPGFGEILFEIVYEKNSINGVAVANLYLLENVYRINGYLQNTLKTHLTTFKDNIYDFLEKSYEFFNIKIIYDEDTQNEKRMIDDKFLESFIVAKKQFMLTMNKFTKDKLQELYKEYFNKRMELLRTQENDFTKAVLENYESNFKQIENYFLEEEANYEILNELLDKCFEDISKTNESFAVYEVEFKKTLLSELDKFVAEATEIEKNAEEKAVKALGKEDRKKIIVIKEQEDIHNTSLKEAEEKKNKKSMQATAEEKEVAEEKAREGKEKSKTEQFIKQIIDSKKEKEAESYIEKEVQEEIAEEEEEVQEVAKDQSPDMLAIDASASVDEENLEELEEPKDSELEEEETYIVLEEDYSDSEAQEEQEEQEEQGEREDHLPYDKTDEREEQEERGKWKTEGGDYENKAPQEREGVETEPSNALKEIVDSLEKVVEYNRKFERENREEDIVYYSPSENSRESVQPSPLPSSPEKEEGYKESSDDFTLLGSKKTQESTSDITNYIPTMGVEDVKGYKPSKVVQSKESGFTFSTTPPKTETQKSVEKSLPSSNIETHERGDSMMGSDRSYSDKGLFSSSEGGLGTRETVGEDITYELEGAFDLGRDF